MRTKQSARQKESLAVAYQNTDLERSFAVVDAWISWLTNSQLRTNWQRYETRYLGRIRHCDPRCDTSATKRRT